MKRGVLISAVCVLVAMSGMVFAFLRGASPYVTVSQAKTSAGTSNHVPGVLDKATFQADLKAGKVRFTIKDEAGDRLDVVYSGPPPANLSEVSQVVVVGGMEGEKFLAHKMQIKCPTRYEGKS